MPKTIQNGPKSSKIVQPCWKFYKWSKMVKNDPNWSKIGTNCFKIDIKKCLKMNAYDPKLSKIIQNYPKCSKLFNRVLKSFKNFFFKVSKGQKAYDVSTCSKVAQNSPKFVQYCKKCSNVVQLCPKLSPIVQNCPNCPEPLNIY